MNKLGCHQQRFMARLQEWKRSLNENLSENNIDFDFIVASVKRRKKTFFHITYQFLIARYSSLFSNKLIWREEPRYGRNLRQKRKVIATSKLKEMKEGWGWKKLKQLLIFVFSWVRKRSWKYAAERFTLPKSWKTH